MGAGNCKKVSSADDTLIDDNDCGDWAENRQSSSYHPHQQPERYSGTAGDVGVWAAHAPRQPHQQLERYSRTCRTPNNMRVWRTSTQSEPNQPWSFGRDSTTGEQGNQAWRELGPRQVDDTCTCGSCDDRLRKLKKEIKQLKHYVNRLTEEKRNAVYTLDVTTQQFKHSKGEIQKENRQLKSEVYLKQKTIKALESQKVNFETELFQLKNENETLASNLDRERNRVIKIKKTRQQLRAQVQSLKDEYEHLKETCRDLQNRLSGEILSGVTQDQNLEDVSNKNRPLVLRDRYEELCSNEWLVAKEYLDEKCMKPRAINSDIWEQIKHELMCEVFTESLAACHAIKENVRRTLNAPIAAWGRTQCHTEDEKGTEELDLPQHNPDTKPQSLESQVEQSIWDYYITAANDVTDVHLVTKTVAQNISSRFTQKLQCWNESPAFCSEEFHTILDIFSKLDEPVEQFIQSACKLCWAMVVQHVPVSFRTSGIGESFNEETQKPYYRSIESGTVTFYLYPAMYHGNKLLQKGTVMTYE